VVLVTAQVEYKQLPQELVGKETVVTESVLMVPAAPRLAGVVQHHSIVQLLAAAKAMVALLVMETQKSRNPLPWELVAQEAAATESVPMVPAAPSLAGVV